MMSRAGKLLPGTTVRMSPGIALVISALRVDAPDGICLNKDGPWMSFTLLSSQGGDFALETRVWFNSWRVEVISQ